MSVVERIHDVRVSVCSVYYKKMLCMVCIVEINAPVVEKSRLCKGTRERGVVT